MWYFAYGRIRVLRRFRYHLPVCRYHHIAKRQFLPEGCCDDMIVSIDVVPIEAQRTGTTLREDASACKIAGAGVLGTRAAI